MRSRLVSPFRLRFPLLPSSRSSSDLDHLIKYNSDRSRSFAASSQSAANQSFSNGAITMASTLSSTTPAIPSVTVHSTFRDGNNQKLKPDGLEWGLPGLSEMCYVPYPPISGSNNIDVTSPLVQRAVVEAHNRWSFAKDLPFVTVGDIASLQVSALGKYGVEEDSQCITAKWKPYHRQETTERYPGMIVDMIQNDKAAKIGTDEDDGDTKPAEVWINGRYTSTLSGPDTLPPIVDAIDNTLFSKKVCYRRSPGLIRTERYFRGMIRGVEVFDHLLDNLYALEDVELIDYRTIIGTVTLPDWIMGGMLTSRLWVSELSNGNVLTQRPLHNDDLRTSDRRYELIKGEHDARIALVKDELKRLRYLAALEHPIDRTAEKDANGKEETKGHVQIVESAVAKQHRINRRRQKMRL